jgi:NAD(P)-dependent dehydrogenase (short-subunit alcohol dehydrogenase family)
MASSSKPLALSPPTIFPTYPDLAGKVALITGIGQVGLQDSDTWGNGAATARILSHNGVKILGCDLNLTAAERTRQRLLSVSPDAICDVMTCDVTKQEDVDKFVATAMEKYGRIDILFNNVGATRAGSPSDMPESVWMGQIDVNLGSVYRCCHAVLPIMEKRGSGCVINNASITALRYIGKPQIAYAVAKAGVIRFTKTSGVMYAGRGIRMNCVVPGLMYTPLVENFGASEKEEDREVFRKITEHNVPQGVMGDSHDVGNAVAWLSSEASRYVNAHALVVDGGITESTGTGG